MVRRLQGEKGFCKTPNRPFISSWGPHFGEEPVLTGHHGSGTIFFTGCNLGCIFCQNYTISHLMEGSETGMDTLADIMLKLQQTGCHNINLVTPTHQIPWIVEAINIAKDKDLNIPIVYNCGGYESTDIIKELKGTIDIYMPDVKTFSTEFSRKYLGAPDYPQIVREVLLAMYEQVGHLKVNREGVAVKGLLIRHLIMPGWTQDSKNILVWIKENLGEETYINIMDQYYPYYRACEFPQICRRITDEEYTEVVSFARKLNLRMVVED